MNKVKAQVWVAMDLLEEIVFESEIKLQNEVFQQISMKPSAFYLHC
jgi:hypothetical protein